MANDKPIGTITHWYDKIGVAVLKLSNTLKQGDKIKVKRHEEEFEDVVASIQVDHKDVESAGKGADAAVKLSKRAKEGALVFKVE